MATIILGTVGRIFGGPIGGILGTAAGGFVDRAVLGGGKPREAGRIGNPEVQSSAYGEPLPVIVGRMRAAGNLVWSSGIKESSARSGGGKRSGPATTNYSYSASFAVALAARAIAAVGRIWADGKLIRDEAGNFLSPAVMRLHRGSEDQMADPLIAAFEGASETPAYRGIAYVVFEDLPLADYGNRVPNLTFEIIADVDVAGSVGDAIAALGMAGGRQRLVVSGDFPQISGHFSARSGSLADAIAPLVEISGASVVDGAMLAVKGASRSFRVIAENDCHAHAEGDRRNRERRKRISGAGVVRSVEIAFYDTSRDYQPGLQRARRANIGDGGGIDHQSVACAMTPAQAKTLAGGLLARSHAGRLHTDVRLPWRHLAVQPGDRVVLGDDGIVWRVRAIRFESFVVNLGLERAEIAEPVQMAGDGGRPLVFGNEPVGPTTLTILDLPSLPGELAVQPRLWVAASGQSPGWRRAGIEISADGGATYAAAGFVEGAAVQGIAVTRLGPGLVGGWDRFAMVEVELLSDAMWLESRLPASVLAGSNLAIIGDEIVQFGNVEPLSPRRFRLSGFLRGRSGTEAAVASHAIGDAFVLLELPSLLQLDLDPDGIGRTYRVRPAGVGDDGAAPIEIVPVGRALRPLAPTHLRIAGVAGAVTAEWTRSSRAGFGWTDFVDAPLAEATEAYRVDVALDGRLVRTVTVDMPRYVYSPADRVADGNGTAVTVTIAQLSAVVGPGTPASITLTIA